MIRGEEARKKLQESGYGVPPSCSRCRTKTRPREVVTISGSGVYCQAHGEPGEEIEVPGGFRNTRPGRRWPRGG